MAWLVRDYTTGFSRTVDRAFEAGLPHTVVQFVHCTKSWLSSGAKNTSCMLPSLKQGGLLFLYTKGMAISLPSPRPTGLCSPGGGTFLTHLPWRGDFFQFTGCHIG